MVFPLVVLCHRYVAHEIHPQASMHSKTKLAKTTPLRFLRKGDFVPTWEGWNEHGNHKAGAEAVSPRLGLA